MTIAQTVADMGFKLSSTLVRDEFDGRDGQSVWSVTIVRNGQSFATEYSMGSAHRHYRGGQKFESHPYGTRMSVDALVRYKQSIPDSPSIDDVLYCFVSDAQCVAYGQEFADFADELGYDEDSRKAEKAFNACRDEYFALVRMCGQDGFEELCELFQDF